MSPEFMRNLKPVKFQQRPPQTARVSEREFLLSSSSKAETDPIRAKKELTRFRVKELLKEY